MPCHDFILVGGHQKRKLRVVSCHSVRSAAFSIVPRQGLTRPVEVDPPAVLLVKWVEQADRRSEGGRVFVHLFPHF